MLLTGSANCVSAVVSCIETFQQFVRICATSPRSQIRGVKLLTFYRHGNLPWVNCMLVAIALNYVNNAACVASEMCTRSVTQYLYLYLYSVPDCVLKPKEGVA